MNELMQKMIADGWLVRVETAPSKGFIATVWTEQSCKRAGFESGYNVAVGSAFDFDPEKAIKKAEAIAEAEIEAFKDEYDRRTREPLFPSQRNGR